MKKCSAALVLLLPFALLLGGCDQTPETAVSRETFIGVNVALRQINPESRDADIARADTLEAYGVTEEELFAFVNAYGRDIEELTEIWQEIQERLEEQDAEPPEQSEV